MQKISKIVKRITSAILAISLCFSTVVFASSSNSINKTKKVAVDDYINDVYLKIQPNDEIISGDSIEISIKNAEFVTDDEGNYSYKEYKENDYSYDFAIAALDQIGEEYVFSKSELFANSNATLPYKIIRRNKTTIEVKLFPIPQKYVNNESVASTKVYYYIPIECKATDEGDLTITVDANETSISGGGTYVISEIVDSDGSTTTTIDEINYFEDSIYLEDITIKENIKNSFDLSKNKGEIKLRLSNGFVFDSNQDKFAVKAGTNINFDDIKTYTVTEDELTFLLPEEIKDASRAISVIITGLKVIADDDEKYGDVNLTISGAGVNKETIKVAERADYGFELTLEDEIPTIYAGRIYTANNDMDEDDNVTAEFKFAETIPNAYIASRKLEFTLPEGVKIVNYEFNDLKRISGITDKASIVDDGSTLRVDKGVELNDNRTDPAEFKIKLWVSADADFSGDITISAKGAGAGEGTINDIIIGKVVTPVTIIADSTVTNLGTQNVSTSDIIIKEKTENTLLKNEDVKIAIDAAFGSDEIGFADNDIDYEIEGDLEIKNFKVKNGIIEFTIDKSSNTEPSTIKIKNVAIGSTRSIPYGNYDLKVYGTAIINNYDEELVDDEKYPTETGEKFLGYFDTTDAYSFTDYIVIKTATGTFDDVVSVTIGNTDCTVNDIIYDMDIAPYIQLSSNSTLVPLRFVAIALGLDADSINNPDESQKIVWNDNAKTATLYYGQGTNQKIIQFTANSNEMKVDGNTISMDYGVTAEITNNRMFVPMRALGNALGIKVNWDTDTKTVTYTSY